MHQKNVTLGFPSKIIKLIMYNLLVPIYIFESLQGNPVAPFLNFTFKNCKGTCFFHFVRYFIPYFRSNIYNGLDPILRGMDVWCLKNLHFCSWSKEKCKILLEKITLLIILYFFNGWKTIYPLQAKLDYIIGSLHFTKGPFMNVVDFIIHNSIMEHLDYFAIFKQWNDEQIHKNATFLHVNACERNPC